MDTHDKITKQRVHALHQGLTMVTGTRLSEGVGPSGGRVKGEGGDLTIRDGVNPRAVQIVDRN